MIDRLYSIGSLPFYKDRVLLISVCLFMFVKRFLLLNFELNYEEGKEIECALNILDGNLVFRDFHWQYGPLGIYVTALLFKIFGHIDLLIPRMLVTLVAVATTFFSYKTARFYLNSSWAFWASLLASSGLTVRENTYGHGFAYLGMIATFYYLLLYFKNEKRAYLIITSFWIALVLLAKPVLFGIGTLALSLFCVGYWHKIVKKMDFNFSEMNRLLVFVLPVGLVYGYLTWETSFKYMYSELFPMSSGALNLGETRFMRPLFPALDFSSLKRFMTSINIYLVNPFRWWLIIFTFLGGLVYWIRFREAWKSDPHHYFNIFILLLFSLLIENETLILINRPITFFINMLPSYILLALVFVWLKNKDWVWSVRVSAFLFAFFYFFYPPFRLGYFYFQYGKPLALPYAKTIRVPPYSWEGYRTIAAHVARQAPSNKPFLFAGYDSFIYFFSGRELYFPDDFATFIRASFHPYNQTNDYFSKSFFDQIERKIIERIEENRPGMIMVPSSWISEQTQKYSLFLKYLNDRWQLEKVLKIGKPRGPFDKIDLEMSVFRPKH